LTKLIVAYVGAQVAWLIAQWCRCRWRQRWRRVAFS